MAQAAIRSAPGDPRIAVVLVGFSALDQLAEAVAASSAADRLTTAELEGIEALYASHFRTHRSQAD